MRSKYNVDNSPAGIEARTVDNIVFASKREMHGYLSLKALLRTGILVSLERQVKFPLHAVEARSGQKATVCVYVADFVAQDKDGKTAIYDSKGVSTQLYKIKKRWFELQYGLRIVEI